MPHNIYRNGKVHVCRVMCPTCVFRPGNKMQLKPGRLKGMIDEALKRESAIPCHHQIFEVEGAPQDAVCRGFWDRHQTQPLQVADRLGLVEFIDPVPKEENDDADTGGRSEADGPDARRRAQGTR